MVAGAHKPGQSKVAERTAGRAAPPGARALPRRIRGARGSVGYNRGVSRFYGPSEANALVPELVTVVTRLGDQRRELVGLRDAFRSREGELVSSLIADEPLPDGDDPELRRLRLRMSGIVDQMAADVAWLDERDIVLRDIATGLLDFPALARRTPGLAVLAPGRGPRGVLARHRRGVRRTPAAGSPPRRRGAGLTST